MPAQFELGVTELPNRKKNTHKPEYSLQHVLFAPMPVAERDSYSKLCFGESTPYLAEAEARLIHLPG